MHHQERLIDRENLFLVFEITGRSHHRDRSTFNFPCSLPKADDSVTHISVCIWSKSKLPRCAPFSPKTQVPLKHSDSVHFKFLFAHSWQPEQKRLNRGGVKHSHQRREEREGSKVYLPLQWPWKQPKMKGAIWLAEQTIGSSLILPWMEHFAQLRTQCTLLLMGHLCSLST